MRRRRTTALVATVTALVLAGAVTTGVLAHDRAAGVSTAPSGAVSATTRTSSGPASQTLDRQQSSAVVPGPTGSTTAEVAPGLQPTRVEVPAIGVDAAVGTLGVSSDGAIEVPSVPSRAGWLDTTPAPGQQGPAVIAGHVDSDDGPAVFYRLSSLQVGDAIRVVRADGTTADFSVDGVRLYPQHSFPTSEVYGPVPGPALRLITCGGDYVKSAGGYQDNVVVYAS